MRCCGLSLFVVLACACSAGPESTLIETVYDPCADVTVVAAGSTTVEQRDGIATAVAMWNEHAGTRLTFGGDGPDGRIEVSFEEAAPVFHGVYRDDRGDIVVNSLLHDPEQRSITIAHELGHAFGLLHITGPEALMNRGNLDTPVTMIDVSELRELWGLCR